MRIKVNNISEKIIKTTAYNREIIKNSTDVYNLKNDNYCYVYLHKIDNKVFYVGMGSHDRAVRILGRSDLWYKTAIVEKITVEIVYSGLTRENAEELERQQILLYTDTCINYQHSDIRATKIVQLTREGEIVRYFDCINQTQDYGFFPNCVSSCCKGKRGLHQNYVWMYADDFNNKGFFMRAASNHSKWLEQVDKQGNVIRKLLSAAAFKPFGFNPDSVQAAASGRNKSCGGYIFRYVD